MTLEEGTAEYAAMETVVNSLGLTMEQAQDYVRNFSEESEHGILSANKVWGDLTDSVIEGSKAWKGTASEIVSALNSINTAITQAAENEHLRTLFGQNGASVSTYQSIADKTGLNVEYIRRNPQSPYVSQMLAIAAQSDADNVATNLNSMGLGIGGSKM